MTKEKADLKRKFENEQAARIRAEKANWVLEDKLGISHKIFTVTIHVFGLNILTDTTGMLQLDSRTLAQ